MDEIIKNAVEEYQCPGCVCGSDISCYVKGDSEACDKHIAGTILSCIGHIFLGMPIGFNRTGNFKEQKIMIWKVIADSDWEYDKFNIPVWKHKNKNGHTIVRGLSPRINTPFIHIFLEDCLDKIECLEITEKDIEEMD